MKYFIAIIKPFKLEDVRNALTEIGVKGFEPDPKDPNESISPVIEFDLDLIFS